MKTPVRQHGHAPFPSREARERIRERRAQLMRAMIDALVARDTDPQLSDAQIGTLAADYGAAEVLRMITRRFAGAIMSGVHVFGKWQTNALMEYSDE